MINVFARKTFRHAACVCSGLSAEDAKTEVTNKSVLFVVVNNSHGSNSICMC